MLKKLFTYIFTVLAVAGLWLGVPQQASAEFPEKPIAFVVLDHSGNVDGPIYKEFRSVAKLIYNFPYYQLQDGGVAQEKLAALVNSKQKLNAVTLAQVAEEAQLEGIVVAHIYEMDERRIIRSSFRDMDDDLVRVTAWADLMVYRKDGNRFLMKKLRESNVREIGDYDHPDYTIKWELSKVINTLEGKEII